MTPSFRGVSARKFADPGVFRQNFVESLCEFIAEFLREISRRKNGSARAYAKSRGEKERVCASLREISQSFLREISRLKHFVRGVNAKKDIFSWADLYIVLFSISRLSGTYLLKKLYHQM